MELAASPSSCLACDEYHPHAMKMARHVALILGLAAVYFVTARLGLTFNALGGVVSTVWPPSGVAMAALLLGGRRLWPGVALGAFAVNVQTVGLAAAAGIATGNTLEAVVGATLLVRARLVLSLERVRDVLALVVLGGFLCTTIAATLGTVSLWLSGADMDGGRGWIWLVWWLGDATGVSILTPLLLVWSRPMHLSLTPLQVLETSRRLRGA